MRDGLAARGTRALLVVRRGKIAYEWYAPGVDANRRHGTASLAKSLVAGMSLLVAIQDGRLKPDDPAWRYIPAWKNHPRKSRITIRHLATHSSGIEDAEQDGIPHMELPGWKGAFWRRKPDPISIALEQAPVVFAPGTGYAYSNPGMAALSYAITASLRGAPQPDVRAALAQRVLGPLEVPPDHWSISYGESYSLDGMTVYANWGGGSFTARATARVGQLLLDEGRWRERRLFDAGRIAEMLAYSGTPLPAREGGEPNPAPAMCWWSNADGIWPRLPRDAFAGAGAGHQVMLVVPSLDLVVVRYGAALTGKQTRAGFWQAVVQHLFDPAVAAVLPAGSGAPYPRSTVIGKVTFAPAGTIVRDAIGSDNWPLTWGDDDHIYTSYGDGWGFAAETGRKLSQGFARIEGPPAAFRGVNIPSPSGERLGDGKAGAKASGMLMIGGVLYAWVRNTGNAQLAWSEDHGRTWQWGFRFETSFGSPAFLNFGKNYAGARDQYVYTYSQDGPSAYESDDGLVLARVRKDRIRDRAAYEFLERLGAGGRPVWTHDLARRGHVFRYPGNCQRVDAVFNPALRRYLLAVGYSHGGGWGLFDAPEPWGPWTTAFHTSDWGLGGTHGYRLPSKWIGPDGRTMYLVFSGVRLPDITYDGFCVRRMRLEPAARSR
jgi:CubicO group peptidase (beta-lactamase class C family)